MKDRKRHGKGILIFPDESIYEGIFMDDKPNGYGFYYKLKVVS